MSRTPRGIHVNAWQQFGYAIVAQAVEDYKRLQAAGVIKDGKPVVHRVGYEWVISHPMQKKRSSGSFAFAYRYPAQVHELIRYLKKGCGDLLHILDSGYAPEDICKRIGLP